MDDSFVHLEEKVLNAIHLIQDLRAENAQLQEQRDELRNLYDAMKEDNRRLNQELEQKQVAAASVEHFEEKRRMIEEKVGGLLEKLGQIG